MAKETKITKQQLETLIGANLVVPVESNKKNELARIFDAELYRATRLGDSVRIRKFNESINELKVGNDNLVFARYQHPQGLALLLSQSNDETEPMNLGYVFTPGDEEFVLDLGRTITVSGSDDAVEQKYSFERGEIFATSEAAAKNWKFNLKRTLIEDIESEDISKEEKLRKIKDVNKQIEQITILIPKIVEMDEQAIAKAKGRKKSTIGVGQLAFEFTEQVVENVVANKANVFDCVMGNWNGEDATMDDVVVCKKVIPTGEYLFEVELVFYNGIKKYIIPEKDNEGILLRNEDGTIKEKIIVEKTPLLDCRIFAYESSIDIEEAYDFDEKTLSVLKDIIVDGKSLVALIDENGKVFLHSLNTFFEAYEFEYAKNYVIENKNSNGVKKGEINKIVSFAEFSLFCSQRKIPKNQFEVKKFACN